MSGKLCSLENNHSDDLLLSGISFRITIISQDLIILVREVNYLAVVVVIIIQRAVVHTI